VPGASHRRRRAMSTPLQPHSAWNRHRSYDVRVPVMTLGRRNLLQRARFFWPCPRVTLSWTKANGVYALPGRCGQAPSTLGLEPLALCVVGPAPTSREAHSNPVRPQVEEPGVGVCGRLPSMTGLEACPTAAVSAQASSEGGSGIAVSRNSQAERHTAEPCEARDGWPLDCSA
jgi:hypothetical protein